jgi:hypothetical protein
METMKKGRGWPRKDGFVPYASSANLTRLDPTGDMFLRTEEREGGPVDPITSFDENLNLLFKERYPQGSHTHPIY